MTPHHIAIVMDGNGRWANKRFLPRVAGHRQGLEALRRCIRLCLDRGVGVLTVFAFSSENWARPADEVSGLMELLAGALAREGERGALAVAPARTTRARTHHDRHPVLQPAGHVFLLPVLLR